MYGIIIVTLLIISTHLHGEANAFDAYGSTTSDLNGTSSSDNSGSNYSSPTYTSGSSIADGVTRNTVQSANQVVEDPETQTNGREYKAENANQQGKTGTGVAIATGSALMASAIPMLASPIASVRAAGHILMSQAAMEFAQAGVDAFSSSKNKAQKDMLTNKSQDSPGSQTTANEIKAGMNNPELDKLLADRGINSDQFKEQLANGELQDSAAVRAAMGDTSQYSAEDLAAGDRQAQGTLTDVFSKVHGDTMSKSVALNEALPTNSSAPQGKEGAGGGASGVGGASGEGKASELTEGIFSGSTALDSKAMAKNSGGSLSTIDKALQEASMDPKALLAKFLGMDSLMALEKKLPGFVRSALERLGITVPLTRQHIFHTAHRNYRSFGKWRKTYRVAMGNDGTR